MPLLTGSRLGPYEVLSPLGAGGMGEVYRARDSRLGRDVAIKALPSEFERDPERLARFEREARLLASLSHPNIAGIHGLEEVAGARYLVLEYVEGETLAARLARGALPMDEAIEVCRQIASGVEAAHESGVVHRDLKPGNVMLTPSGAVKVLDFGLAKSGVASTSGLGTGLSASPTLTVAATSAGVILGTAAYMSPEQARGRAVDRRTDVWSFGCVLYECLTGRQAYEGETVSDVIARILEREPDWGAVPAATPPRVVELLRRCLTKDPKLRLRDIGEARVALERSREPLAAAAPAGLAARGAPGILPWLVAALAVAVAIAAIGIARRPAPATGAKEVSIVVAPGYTVGTNTGYHFAALSPDGRVLAYAARGEGTIALRTHRLDRREDAAIPGTEEARDPFFSPDGEWLGFFNSKNLLKVSLHGGAPVPIATTGQDRGGAWLDDGTIVFGPEATQPLYAIRTPGAAPVPVTTLDTTRQERTHRWPCALDGGPWVVFTVGVMTSPGDYDGADIDAVSVKTGERRHLIHGGRRAVWAPPNHLVFDRSGSLYAVEIDPRNPRVTGEPVPVLDGVAGESSSGAAFLDIARDGTMAWMPSEQDEIQRQIGWYDRAGHWTPTMVAPGEYRHLALSPDGRRALVLVGAGGGAGDIWLADLTDGGLRRLTDTRSSSPAAWLPDGVSFVQSSSDTSGASVVELRRLDGAGGPRTLFVNGPPILVSSVTPRGDALLFSDYGSARGRMHLLSLSPGAHPETIPTDESTTGEEQAGAIAPVGDLLAYISNRTGREEVFVEHRGGGGGRWQVSTRGGGGVRWGRDGRELFFITDETLMRVTVTAREGDIVIGQPEAMFPVPASPIEPTYRDYAYDPVSDRFLFTRPPQGSEQRRVVALSIGWGARLGDLAKSRREAR